MFVTYTLIGLALWFLFLLFVGRNKPPKGKSHPGYAESRDRVYWWRLIYKQKENQDTNQDWKD